MSSFPERDRFEYLLAILILLFGIGIGVDKRFLPIVLTGLSSYILYGERHTLKGRVFLGLSVSFFIIFLLMPFGKILLPFAVGMWIAFLVAPTVRRLEKLKIPRVIATLILLLLALFVIVFFFTYFIYQVGNEGAQFLNALPSFIEKWKDFLEAKLGRTINIEDLMSALPTLQNVIEGLIKKGAFISKGVFSLFGYLVLFVITLVVTFYVIKDYEKLKLWIIDKIRGNEEYLALTDEVVKIMRRYFRGQLLDALLVGFLTGILLFFCKIKFALLLGFLTGVMNLIPNLGFWMSFLPALFVGLMAPSPIIGLLKVAAIFGFVQLLESVFFVPKIIGGSIGLHPLIIFLAIILGGRLLGPLGLILAVPVAALLKAILMVVPKKTKREVKDEG